MSEQIPLRPQCQIQLAHDVLHAVAAKEIDLGISEEQRQKVHIAHDVLSWVLQGPCGHPFQAILLEMMREAEKRGYKLARIQ